MSEKLFLPGREITVQIGRQRASFNQKDMEKLKSSLLTIGQIEPIIITREKVLVVGERRLRACLDLDLSVWCAYVEETDPYTLKKMELEENICRSDLTAPEVILAKDELHQIEKEHYKAQEWGIAETATLLNESKSQTAEDLKLATFIKAAPLLFGEADTKTEVKRIVKKLERQMEWDRLRQATELLTKKKMDEQERSKSPREIKEEKEETQESRRTRWLRDKILSYKERVKTGDAFEELSKLPDNSINIFLLDPDWGISHHEKQKEGEDEFEDLPEDFKREFPILCRLVFQKAAPKSHLYCFFAIIYHEFVYNSLEEAGFQTNRRPIIVCKKGIASTRVADVWPGAGYEPVAFARKGHRPLVIKGRPDWFDTRWTTPTEKAGHPWAKPATVYAELLRRSAYPGDKVCDPMYGSGAAFVGCELLPELKLQWFGWDNVEDNKYRALLNLTKFITGGGEEDE